MSCRGADRLRMYECCYLISEVSHTISGAKLLKFQRPPTTDAQLHNAALPRSNPLKMKMKMKIENCWRNLPPRNLMMNAAIQMRFK